MLELPEVLGYAIWDEKDFIIPKEFDLSENSRIQDALRVFYAAGGYDFFKVVNPAKYAANWLDFMGNLYSDIEDGKYKSDETHYSIPLSEDQKISLIEQGVPEIFTKDFKLC